MFAVKTELFLYFGLFLRFLYKKYSKNLHVKKRYTTFATSNDKGVKNSSVAQSVRAPDC